MQTQPRYKSSRSCFQWIHDSGGWSSDQKAAGSTPALTLLRNNVRQVIHTLVLLSPSTISWYRCKNREGNDRLYKRCGLPFITLSVSSLLAQNHGNGDERHTLRTHNVASVMRGRCWLIGHFRPTWLLESDSKTAKFGKLVDTLAARQRLKI